MTLGHIYQLWEDCCRPDLAELMGYKSKSCLESEVFKELGAIRHSIVHNLGRCTSVCAKNRILSDLKEGEQIVMSDDEMLLLRQRLDAALAGIQPGVRCSQCPRKGQHCSLHAA